MYLKRKHHKIQILILELTRSMVDLLIWSYLEQLIQVESIYLSNKNEQQQNYIYRMLRQTNIQKKHESQVQLRTPQTIRLISELNPTAYDGWDEREVKFFYSSLSIPADALVVSGLYIHLIVTRGCVNLSVSYRILSDWVGPLEAALLGLLSIPFDLSKKQRE